MQAKIQAMTKVEKSNEIINPFGGINFVLKAIKDSGIPQLIDKELGSRSSQAMYSYSDLFLNLWSVIFCGGEVAEDINNHLKDFLEDVPNNKVTNADTILGVLKKFATQNEKVVSSSGQTYEVNVNMLLNTLNIKILLHLGILKKDNYYDFDFDNEVLKTNKFDAKNTYKHSKGYFPGMVTIHGIPVYFENRAGNMSVKTNQAELLKRAYTLLTSLGIKINRSRMDAGSYSKEIIDVVDEYSQTFYIRANRSDYITKALFKQKTWEKIELNHKIYEVCSIEYKPFTSNMTNEEKEKAPSYRLVVSREESNNKQMNLFTEDNMKYRSIITNDRKSSEKHIISYYNQRGEEEKTIDIMNNDFAWKQMPFSFMNENTVFMIVMMMCKNVYTWLISKFSKTFDDLKPYYRIKKFIFRFITIPVKWIKRSRYDILKVFSKKNYEFLRI